MEWTDWDEIYSVVNALRYDFRGWKTWQAWKDGEPVPTRPDPGRVGY